MSNTRETGLHLGLLLMRVGIGAMFVFHGWPKISGGEKTWKKLGKAMEVFDVSWQPEVWGFLAAAAEFGGGILLIAGLGVRTAALAMAATMFVAAASHLHGGDGLKGAAHAIEAFSAFLALALMGGGRFSMDHAWFARD